MMISNRKLIKTPVILAILSLIIAACGGDGGGGGGNNDDENDPPSTDTTTDTTPPSNYQISTNITEINSTNHTAFSFTIEAVPADVGSSFSYSIEDSVGSEINGTGVLASATQTVNSIDVSALAPGTLTISVTLSDSSNNIGEPVSLTVNKSTSADDVTISGSITYDFVPHNTFTNGLNYFATTPKPARGVQINLLAADNSVLASTTTDELGDYQFDVSANTDVRIRVNARLLSVAAPIWDMSVTDNTNNNALYVMQGSVVNSGTTNSIRDLHAPSGWTGSSYTQTRVAAPFAILDTIYEAKRRVTANDPNLVLTAAEIRWSENNTTADGELTDGDIGNSHFNPSEDSIYLLGDDDTDIDEYDPHVVAHEWCHYFEFYLGKTDNRGGPHSIGDRTDMTVAHSEGMCNAFSGIIADDAFYRDSGGPGQAGGFSFNMESNVISNSGWYNEASVSSIIYDIFDATNDGADTIEESLDYFKNVLTSDDYAESDALTSIYLFLSVLKSQLNAVSPSSSNAVDDLATAQNISTSSIFGVGETNDAGDSRTLPIYGQISVGGPATQVCSFNDFGTKNKLGNYARVRFSAAVSGFYTIAVTRSSGAVNSDPNFHLRLGSTLIAIEDSTDVDSETLTRFLPSGNYSLEIFDSHNTGDDAGDDYCFDVEVD